MSKQVETVPVAGEGADAAVVTGLGSDVPVVDRGLVAQLVGEAQRQGLPVDGEGGLLAELTRLVLESALEGEITDHLVYDKHERGGSVDGNARNGTRTKTVLSKAGPVQVDVLRDRAGTFEPKIVAKRQRRARVDRGHRVVAVGAGMTHGDISAHLADVYGSDVSKTTISMITDKVLEGMAEWQNLPLAPGRFLTNVANPDQEESRSALCAEQDAR